MQLRPRTAALPQILSGLATTSPGVCTAGDILSDLELISFAATRWMAASPQLLNIPLRKDHEVHYLMETRSIGYLRRRRRFFNRLPMSVRMRSRHTQLRQPTGP